MKTPELFRTTVSTYSWELLWKIKEAILFIDNFEGDTTERVYTQTLRFLETFVGNDKKSRMRKTYGIASYMRIDFFNYPLQDLQTLSRPQLEKMNLFQNEVILQEIENKKDEIISVEKDLLALLKKVGSPFSISLGQLQGNPQYYFQ